jgi:hypothetical protein
MLILREGVVPMQHSLAVLAAFGITVSASAAAGERAAPPASDGTAALIRAIAGDPTKRHPLAKLRGPLCLTVAAQDVGFARTVAERIIANAKAAGVPTRRAGCRTNALVMFSEDAATQIAAYRAEGKTFFRHMREREIDAALSGRDPAYVFQAIEPTPRIGEGDAAAGENWTKERSYLRTPQDLVTTLVVIENRAAGSSTPQQLADYATLRLLAQTGEIAAEGHAASHTILSLFATPGAAPPRLSRFDRAYLKSLYKLPRTAFAEEVLAAALAYANRGDES